MLQFLKGRVIVSIYDNLLNIPQRENAGSLVPNRYKYQYHWSLAKILDLYETQDDFAMFFEFGDDVLILDSSKEPKTLDFYQIKTRKQNNTLYWTLSNLTNKGTKTNPKQSIIENLIDNYARYKYENIKSIQLVSNLPFKFDMMVIQSEQNCKLELLSDKEIQKIFSQTCHICKKTDCNEECKSIICFSCSGIPIDYFKETCIGKLNNFLVKKYPNFNLSPQSLYDVLLKDIEIKSMKIGQYISPEDLIKDKCISKDQLDKQLNEFHKNSILHNQWTEMDQKFSKIFPINQRKNIKREFKKYIIDSLNPENILLEKINKTIQLQLKDKTEDKEINDDELKNIFDDICDYTISNIEIDTSVYNKDYIMAIILREYCYE